MPIWKGIKAVGGLVLLAGISLPLRCSSPAARSLLRICTKDKWGYIDAAGSVLIEPQFDFTYGFFDGLAAVKVNGKWGYIDTTGKMVISPQFDQEGDFSEGLANVAIGNKHGYISESGVYGVRPQFDDAKPFKDGMA